MTLPRIDGDFVHQILIVIENLSARMFRCLRSVKFSESRAVAFLPIVAIWLLFLIIFLLFFYSSRNPAAVCGMIVGAAGCEMLLFSVLPVLVSE